MKYFTIIWNRFGETVEQFANRVEEKLKGAGTIARLRLFENPGNEDVVLEALIDTSAAEEQRIVFAFTQKFTALEAELNRLIQEETSQGKQIKFVQALPFAGTSRALGIVVAAKVKASGIQKTKRRKAKGPSTQSDPGSEDSAQ